MSTNPPAKRRAKRPNYLSTTNACKLCTPLGACLAFKGIEGAVAVAETLGIDPTRRAETVSVAEWVELARALGA